MWIWDARLIELGFRRKSADYWKCVDRYGLADGSYLSVFSWSTHRAPRARSAKKKTNLCLIEVTEFHVTVPLGGERLHFYYHQCGEDEWEPGGHTPQRRIRRVGGQRVELRAAADAVAVALVRELGGTLRL